MICDTSSVFSSLGASSRACIPAAVFLHVVANSLSINTASSRFAYPDPTHHELSALIRIGHKYQVDPMVQRNVEYLKSFYTDDVEAWWSASECDPPDSEPMHAIGVVNLARLTGTHSMLPAALLTCTTLPPETITRGFVRPDGSRETLSMEDMGRCLSGAHANVEATIKAMYRQFSAGPSNDCVRPRQCRPIIRNMLDGVLRDNSSRFEFKLNWWQSWHDYIDGVDHKRELCWKCHDMLGYRTDVDDAIFGKLPEVLELTEAMEH